MVKTREIKKGYKHTEVGPIPQDWDIKDLGELGTWRGGMTPSMQNRLYWLNGDIPWISSGDVKSVQLKKTAYSITSAAVKQGTTTLLPAKSIIIVTRSGILRKYLPVATNVIPMAINQDIKALIPGQEYSPAFVLQALLSNGPRILSLCMKSGTTVESVEFRWLKAYTIPVPSLPEQEAIAEALNDVDHLITLLELAIEKKQNIKIATMQQLLSGKKRLQGFKGKWEKIKLGDLLAYEQPTRYLVKNTEYNDNHETPVLTAGKTFILGYTNETTGIFSNLPVIIFDDFTTANKYVTFPFKAKSSAMKMLLPRHKEINLRFVFEKIQLLDFKLGDHKRYWISEYQHIELEMPKPDEQTAIASVLSDMDNEITELKTRLRKTKEQKQAMMHQLLTGSIRLV